MKKIIKKITCTALAAVSVFACGATFTACETSHPEVEMKIEFNGESYTLDYKLYRKVAPATVEHFLFLAGNGYYDGLCVHDYATSANRLYTGAYSVTSAAETELIYKPYYEEIKKYSNIASFPHSVWLDSERNTPSYTLKGEFEDNGFGVESGALKETFGSLTMYYYGSEDGDLSDTRVQVVRACEEGKFDSLAYKYNHATSMFFISLSTTSKVNNSYCTFATLEKKSTDDLENLQEAIADYIEDNYGDDSDEDFTTQVSEKVFEDDAIFGETEEEKAFSVPKAPIVIRQVKVTKY